jgi:hypothetical protein
MNLVAGLEAPIASRRLFSAPDHIIAAVGRITALIAALKFFTPVQKISRIFVRQLTNVTLSKFSKLNVRAVIPAHSSIFHALKNPTPARREFLKPNY